MHAPSVQDILDLYNPSNTLEKASTIPAPWYRDKRIEKLERISVFSGTWHVTGRLDQVREKRQFFTADVAGEPIVVVRGDDAQLRGFYNVRSAPAVLPATEAQVRHQQFRRSV